VKIFHKGLRQLLAAHPHWRPSPTGSGHLKLTSPTGAVVYAVARALKNLRAQLRRLERGGGGRP